MAGIGVTTADTIMAGQLGAEALAAVATGGAYVGIFYLLGIGLLMALSPTVAHAYGAGDDARVGQYFRQSLWLALVLALVAVVGLSLAEPVLLAIGTPRATAILAADYVQAVACGMPALMLFLALRFCSEGVGWTKPIMFTAIVGLLANISLNYVFIYGKYGAPALGAVGCGVATAIVQWLLLGMLVVYVRRYRVYRPYGRLPEWQAPNRQRLLEVLRLALPICGSVLAEGALFSAAGLMASTLGPSVIAAHAIAINYAAMMFMVPLSLHSATTIHVGHRLGAGDARGGARAGWIGILCCVVFMAVSALALIAAREPVAALYTDDLAVQQLAANLLLFAAAFQLADGMQVGAAGALRGFKDAHVPMLLNVAAYWLLAFPLAWYWGIARQRDVVGIWLGLIVGLLVCAMALGGRYFFIARRATALQASQV
jgi:MATE family multidrug resistance protein